MVSEEENKTRDLLRFYRKNNQQIQLTYNGSKIIGVVKKVFPFLRPYTILDIGENDLIKVFLSDIESSSVLPAKINFEYKRQRKSIPKSLKTKLWWDTFGSNSFGICDVCKNPIERHKFEAGHKVSFKNGGSDKSDNLVPLCFGCNRSMGSQNLEDFKIQFHS